MRVSVLQIAVAAVVSAYSIAAFGSPGMIPVAIVPESPAPMYVNHLVIGAPSDSLVLRVTLCTTYDMANEVVAYIVIDEMRWPTPPSDRGIVQQGDGSFVGHSGVPEDKWLLTSSRIDGGYLNAAVQELPPPENRDGVKMRAGHLGTHWLRPFAFVQWNSPLEFVVEDGVGRYTIRWRAPNEFELVEVSRVK